MSRERNIWNSLKQRCLNPRNGDYAVYGGRGISVCDRWRNDFSAFYDDMGPCPDGFTIERIDGNKGYQPDNCKWASRAEQRVNTTRITAVTVNGETLNLTDAALKFGINRSRLRHRIEQGWPHEFAVTAPRQKSGPPLGTTHRRS